MSEDTDENPQSVKTLTIHIGFGATKLVLDLANNQVILSNGRTIAFDVIANGEDARIMVLAEDSFYLSLMLALLEPIDLDPNSIDEKFLIVDLNEPNNTLPHEPIEITPYMPLHDPEGIGNTPSKPYRSILGNLPTPYGSSAGIAHLSTLSNSKLQISLKDLNVKEDVVSPKKWPPKPDEPER